MFIEPNKPVTVDELLHGMIIQSGNDATIALAEGIASSEEQFVEMMNKQAAKLGLTNTHFMNATGLPDKDHYTTADDLAKLASALIRDFPLEYHRLYSVKEYTYNKITQPNRNRLLWLDVNVDGMKTGHTETAGYCLISSSKRGNSRLVSVVLGAATEAGRATESQKLLNYGFQFYETTLVYKQAQVINTLRVYKGQDKTVAATVTRDFYLTLPKGDYSRVKASMTSQQPLVAPIKAGQEIGKITFSLDNNVINEQKLVAAKTVDEAGFFGRMVDSVKLLIQ
jgi:D-alanyl-D-alanine carboxypeptidase (penicillin-binding protein 5/6)